MIVHVLVSLCMKMLMQKGFTFPAEVSLVLSELTILVPSVIYILIKRFDFEKDLGFRRIKTGSFFMCILLAVLLNPVASFVNVLSQLFVSNTLVQVSDELLGGSNAIVLFLASVYGPFCEEFLFRSIFFNRYSVLSGSLRAGLISSLFFALAHMNVNQAAYTFVLGFIFSVINRAAGSVYPSLIVHMCINVVNVFLLILMTSFNRAMGGQDIFEAAEAARKSDAIYIMAAGTLVAALISTAVAIPCIVWMAKHEGYFEDLRMMFSKERKKGRCFTLSSIAAVVFLLFMMFGLKPVLEIIG